MLLSNRSKFMTSSNTGKLQQHEILWGPRIEPAAVLGLWEPLFALHHAVDAHRNEVQFHPWSIFHKRVLDSSVIDSSVTIISWCFLTACPSFWWKCSSVAHLPKSSSTLDNVETMKAPGNCSWFVPSWILASPMRRRRSYSCKNCWWMMRKWPMVMQILDHPVDACTITMFKVIHGISYIFNDRILVLQTFITIKNSSSIW